MNRERIKNVIHAFFAKRNECYQFDDEQEQFVFYIDLLGDFQVFRATVAFDEEAIRMGIHFPFRVPQSQLQAMAELTTVINRHPSQGKLDLDRSSGTLCYHTMISCQNSDLDPQDLVAALVQGELCIVGYSNLFMMVLSSQMSPEETASRSECSLFDYFPMLRKNIGDKRITDFFVPELKKGELTRKTNGRN